MNETLPTARPDVVVIGAGLAGLATAQLVRRAGCSVVVLDGQPAGGRGRTDERRGFLFNRGPHALYRGGHAEAVLATLGVRATGGAPGSSAFGLLGERVAALPTGAVTLLRSSLLGWKAKVGIGRLLTRLPKVRAETLAEVSFRDWLSYADLPRDGELLVEMLARVASYTNAPEMVSADLVVGQMQMALGRGVRYLDGGWQSLVSALVAALDVQQGTATSVSCDGGAVVVECSDRAPLVARAAIVAVGTPAAASSLLGRTDFDVGAPVEAACLDLGITGAIDPSLLFGLDAPLYLSAHSPAATLAPAHHSVVHVARYLAPDERTEPIAQRAELDVHAARVGITADRIVEHRYLHRMTVVGALTTASRGGMPARPGVADVARPGVFLAGDWVGRRGHLLDAALASAEEAAAAAVKLIAR
ncbi:MAG: FAD-dependent oxidoreductase [Actinomycetota bacterium]